MDFAFLFFVALLIALVCWMHHWLEVLWLREAVERYEKRLDAHEQGFNKDRRRLEAEKEAMRVERDKALQKLRKIEKLSKEEGAE